ncbi:unnamed protein product [Polarella glacialis]|uniref:Uncharacterized protein n=1 Tax=Polarella glacialis TaxID=89957 RepID=A0A813GXE6_POLGL|nr:unnamed protein product [Polarella glacialis]CAE8741015.1 unnamed protein product [Polarella glacialis]
MAARLRRSTSKTKPRVAKEAVATPASTRTAGGDAGSARLVPLAEDLDALRSLSRPPPVIRRLCEALHWILCLPDAELRGRALPQEVAWTTVRSSLCSPFFQERLLRSDLAESLRSAPSVTAHFRAQYLAPGAPGGPLEPVAMRNASEAAGAVFDWMLALLEEAGQLPDGVPSVSSENQVSVSSCPIAAPADLLGKHPGCVEAAEEQAVEEEPWRRDPSLGLPAGVTRYVAVVTGGRSRSLTIARQLLPHSDLLVLLGLGGGMAACAAANSRLKAEDSSMARRVDIQPLGNHSNNNNNNNNNNNRPERGRAGSGRGGPTEMAQRAAYHYGSVGSLIIDCQAFVQDQRKQLAPGSLPSVMLKSTAEIFHAFLPHLGQGARVVILSSDTGVATALRTSSHQLAFLFQRQDLQLSELQQLAEQFSAESAAARVRSPSGGAPCESSSGLWLDDEGFAHTLVLALSLVWHRQHQDLAVCACACAAVQDLDVAEAQAAAFLAAARGPPADVSGRLFGNGAFPRPWISKGFTVADQTGCFDSCVSLATVVSHESCAAHEPKNPELGL